MKSRLITFLFLITFTANGFSQTYNSNELKNKAETFAKDIFRDYPSYITSDLLSRLEVHLSRIEVKEITKTPKENYILLSSINLINKYNNDLKRDNGSFDFATFNPLKYALNYDSPNEIAYRIDNTNYVIFIRKAK